MTIWTDRLDSIQAGQATKPTVVEILRLPDIVSWEPGQVVTKWETDEDFFTTGGQLFGGYLGALADQVMGHTAMSVLEDENAFRTAQMNVTFYRPVRNGVLWITGKVTCKTRQAIHVQVEFTDADGTPMCSVSGIQIVFPRSPRSTPPR
jgi:uncharacterized protein (TIGR00369 family)